MRSSKHFTVKSGKEENFAAIKARASVIQVADQEVAVKGDLGVEIQNHALTIEISLIAKEVQTRAEIKNEIEEDNIRMA